MEAATQIHCYRVWMKDGYASLKNGETEAEAREAAIQQAKDNTRGAAMSAHERVEATTVDYVTKLSD